MLKFRPTERISISAKASSKGFYFRGVKLIRS